MYKVQIYDTDSESWEDWDEITPSNDKSTVESEAKYLARQCAYRVKWRIVNGV